MLTRGSFLWYSLCSKFFPELCPRLRVTSACLKRKVDSKKESRLLFWDSVWPEPYRWIWDGEKKVLMKSPTGDKQEACFNYPGSWAVLSREFHFIPQLFLDIPIDIHYSSLSKMWHWVNIWDFLLIQYSRCLLLSHLLQCNLSINDSHAFD